MKAGLILPMLLAAAAVPAVLAAPASAQAPAPGAAPKIPGVSDAGNAIIGRSVPLRNQALVPLVQQQNALGTQLNAAVSGSTLDVARFGTLLQQRRTILNQLLTKQDEWMVGVLNQLAPADRLPFVRALAAKPNAGGAPAR